MTKERRNHPRVRASHPVCFFTNSYPRSRLTKIVDLSMGGTAIETPYSLITGQVIELSIAIQPKVIKCTGQVVHILWSGGERPKAGIRFEKLSKHDRYYLGEYIARLIEQRD